MMKKSIFLLFLFSAWAAPLFSQVKGTISNAKQKPVKGMKIWRKNTTESVKTGDTGFFQFDSLLPTDTLVVFVSKRDEAVIPVGSLKDMAIVLDKKDFALTDNGKEVRMEYRKVPRISLSSNILTREQIERMSANSLYDILRSSIPGVTVTEGATGSLVTIRGGNSFESNIEPLFVIDGAQYESSTDADSRLSVNEIERIEVQKEGGEYGVKGANGVIIITTARK